MPFLRNASSGAFIGPLDSDSAEYRYLQAQRSGNKPVWEDTGVEDAEAAGALVDGKVLNTIQVLADAVAAAADASFVVGRAPYTGVVNKVEYFPEAAVTGAATNTRTLNGVNLGAAGTGNTNVASLALVSGTNLTAQQSNVIPLNGTPANLVVAPNDEIEFQSLHAGTGIADPGGLVVVTFTRD